MISEFMDNTFFRLKRRRTILYIISSKASIYDGIDIHSVTLLIDKIQLLE